ncbi:hypothetical protein [Bradyrhizobium yuanmingense]|uniref:hypothetical protein n=1 Tax=Bradyrhizobium yuanmingense TaxID=108015 RepID=UPI001FF06B9B|nr:hypothetical protein [Bradyrhizobium yuanmingense]
MTNLTRSQCGPQGVELERPVVEEARQLLPMIERVADVIRELEPPEIIDRCLSNDGNASTKGSECSLRAASLMSGDQPRAMASMA